MHNYKIYHEKYDIRILSEKQGFLLKFNDNLTLLFVKRITC